MCSAISVSLADRPRLCSTLCTADSTSRDVLRMLRGSQSFARSSSSIAPRIRWLA